LVDRVEHNVYLYLRLRHRQGLPQHFKHRIQG